jgi:hypothetical protein
MQPLDRPERHLMEQVTTNNSGRQKYIRRFGEIDFVFCILREFGAGFTRGVRREFWRDGYAGV